MPADAKASALINPAGPPPTTATSLALTEPRLPPGTSSAEHSIDPNSVFGAAALWLRLHGQRQQVPGVAATWPGRWVAPHGRPHAGTACGRHPVCHGPGRTGLALSRHDGGDGRPGAPCPRPWRGVPGNAP